MVRLPRLGDRAPARGCAPRSHAAAAGGRPTAGSSAAVELLRLQRTVGNRAVAALLEPCARPADPVLRVQRKRTAIPQQRDQLRKVGGFANLGLKGAEYDRETKDQSIWNALVAVYADVLGKGERNWRSLQEAIDGFLEAPEAYAQTMAKLRASYDERFASHYVTEVRDASQAGDGPDARQVHSSGFVGQKPASVTANVYFNVTDPVRGTIRALDNYATKDEARIEDEKRKGQQGYKPIGLPNSEILWQQQLEAARRRFWVFRETRARELMVNIAKITRENIQNPVTRAVVFMAYPNDVPAWSQNLRWSADTEEFRALLGTPNVAPAVFMAIDHMDELGGKTISGITTNTGEQIEIDYQPLPEEWGQAILNLIAAREVSGKGAKV